MEMIIAVIYSQLQLKINVSNIIFIIFGPYQETTQFFQINLMTLENQKDCSVTVAFVHVYCRKLQWSIFNYLICIFSAFIAICLHTYKLYLR